MNEFNTHQVRFKVVIKIIFTGLGKTKNYKTWVKKFSTYFFPISRYNQPSAQDLFYGLLFGKTKMLQCLEIHAISLEGTRLRCTSLLFFSKYRVEVCLSVYNIQVNLIDTLE